MVKVKIGRRGSKYGGLKINWDVIEWLSKRVKVETKDNYAAVIEFFNPIHTVHLENGVLTFYHGQTGLKLVLAYDCSYVNVNDKEGRRIASVREGWINYVIKIDLSELRTFGEAYIE